MRSSSIKTAQIMQLPELSGAAASTGSGDALLLQSWSWSWQVSLVWLRVLPWHGHLHHGPRVREPGQSCVDPL